MICTFIGHRDASDKLYSKVKDAIKDLYINHDVKKYYVGNNGSFDFIVQSVLKSLISEGFDLQYSIYLSAIDELALNSHQERTLFPEELESIPRRFAISRRNDLMIKKSSYLICYVNHIASNSYKLVQRAKARNLNIIEIVS